MNIMKPVSVFCHSVAMPNLANPVFQDFDALEAVVSPRVSHGKSLYET